MKNSTNLSADSLQAPQIQIVWGFLPCPRDRQWDHMLLWSASLSNRLRALKAHSSLFKCCEKAAQTLCTGYKKNFVVLDSGYFFDYLRHWKWFLLSLLILNLFLYILFNSRGGCHWQGTALGPESPIGRPKKWHWQGREVTQGPKCHIGVL